MKEIKRFCEEKLLAEIVPGKAILLLGARRVGKTFLAQKIAKQIGGNALILNGDDFDAQELLRERTIGNYQRLFKNVDFLLLDEAQAIPEIGEKLKLIVDCVPAMKILATGSSSFDLLNRAGDALVGRSTIFRLYPFSQAELSSYENALETRQNLESRLIFGAYPQVVCADSDDAKIQYLKDVVDAYLLKDILALDGLRNAAKMRDLLRLLALQCGEEVSVLELARTLGLSRNTVEKYLDLLEKVFVIFRLRGFSRNLRKEIAKSDKWYFCDLGVRNAILNRFSPLALRDDAGTLWENYVISEKIKQNAFARKNSEFYFWRTYTQQEIDLIEVTTQSEILATEIKWKLQKVKIPSAFREAYGNAKFQLISRENYLDFIE